MAGQTPRLYRLYEGGCIVKRSKTALLTLALAISALAAVLGNQARGSDWRDLYLDAKPILDTRYRFEFVDQDGRARNATANTVRIRAGFETGRYMGFGLGFDVEWIEAIGPENFNSTVNGNTRFPAVVDPDDEQINRLYIVSQDTIPDTLFKLGRQRVIWDNQRFIGSIAFRQHEQTFDAASGVVTAIPDTELEYVYLAEVRRIFGSDSAIGNLGLDGHGMRARYSGFKPLAVTPFALLLDYEAASQATVDSQSYGVLLDGSQAIDDDWRLLYTGSAAYQLDYADNPSDFAEWYYLIEPGVAYGKIALKAGYEVLTGDGTSAFQTSLGTNHKFNGLSDQFLVTPPDGLEDAYLSLAAPLPGAGPFSGWTLRSAYHRFWAETGGAHYGSEWDAGIFKKIELGAGWLNLGIQFASYHADSFSSDTDKLWLTLQFNLGPKPLRGYLGGGGY